MYGGRSAAINEHVYELNLEKWTWTKFLDSNLKGRYGHSALNWEGTSFIFYINDRFTNGYGWRIWFQSRYKKKRMYK